MKNYIVFIVTLLIVLQFIVIGFLYSKNNSFSNRFNVLSKQIELTAVCDSETIQDLSKRQFKEDYYIEQQNRDTTLILFVFGAVITGLGFFSFKTFDARLLHQQEQQTRTNEESLNKIKIYEHKLKNLEVKISIDDAEKNRIRANEFLKEKEYYKYLVSSLLSVKNTTALYFQLKEENSDLHKDIEFEILKNLNVIYSTIKSHAPLTDIKDFAVGMYLQEIRKMDSIKIDRIASLIHSTVLNDD